MLRVEGKDETVAPSTHAQFHPPSSSWWASIHSTIPSTSAPSQRPLDSVHELMQQSTSPLQ